MKVHDFGIRLAFVSCRTGETVATAEQTEDARTCMTCKIILGFFPYRNIELSNNNNNNRRINYGQKTPPGSKV